jgi:proton-coupled amino acid transporter
MGYIAGPIFMILLMACAVTSLQFLVQASRAIGSNSQKHSYVNVSRATFGTPGAGLTYIASISASMGVCGSYLLFIAANLQSLLQKDLSQGSIIVIVLPFAILLSSVTEMKSFAFTSLLGDVSVVLGMFVCVWYGLMYHTTDIGNGCVSVTSLENMPLAFGAIGYLFLIHFLVLPIYSSMENPERFDTVVKQSFSICAILSGSFGVIGYLLFGTETKQIVLLNVQGSYFVSVVKVLLCVDLLLTYPVVMRPSIVIVEQSLAPFLLKSSKTKYHQEVGWGTHMTTCILLGLVAAGASIFVPAFGLLSGLVGGVSQTFLAFVLPPLMLATQQKRCPNHLTKVEYLLVFIGLALISWTLISTLDEV